MAEVQPLTDEDIAAIEYDAKRGALSLPLLWGRALETIRQHTEAAEYSTQRWEIASQKWAEALRQRDEAVALLVDVEKYNHDFISPGWMARRNVFLATLERRAPYGVATDA